jgi:hypothetical protein
MNNEFENYAAAVEKYRKKPGAAYVLIFGHGPNKKKGFAGFLDSTTRVPVIDLGEKCVCCDKQATTYREMRGDGLGDYYGGHIYKAPVCDECYSHAQSSALASHTAGVFAGIGVCLMLLGIFTGWGYAAVGAILVFPVILLSWGRSWVAKQRAEKGHYSGLDFSITDGYVTLFTYNPRLAKEMIDRYDDIVTVPKWKKPNSHKAT